MLERIKDAIQGKMPLKKKRHPNWPELRNRFIAENPTCAACGGTKKLEVHHLVPVHTAEGKARELDWSNLITLCRRGKYGIKCHQLVGHRGSYRKANPSCKSDAAYWLDKITDP